MNEFEGIGTLSLLALLYFLPAIVAMMRGHRNAGSVTILNLFLGWTLPDLLEALQRLERTAGISSMEDDPSRVAARAAIAEAKG